NRPGEVQGHDHATPAPARRPPERPAGRLTDPRGYGLGRLDLLATATAGALGAAVATGLMGPTMPGGDLLRRGRTPSHGVGPGDEHAPALATGGRPRLDHRPAPRQRPVRPAVCTRRLVVPGPG